MSSLEQVLKAYEGPDQFFLHNINACRRAATGNLCTIIRASAAWGKTSTSGHHRSRRLSLWSVASRRGPSGGAGRSRTDDILLAKQALYQLSYGPIHKEQCEAQESLSVRVMLRPNKAKGLRSSSKRPRRLR